MSSIGEFDFQHYCNYPERSKLSKSLIVLNDEQDLSEAYSDSSSTGSPSCSSAVSEPASQVDVSYFRKTSQSMYNYLNVSPSEEGSILEDVIIPSEYESETSSEEDDQNGEKYSQVNILNYIDPDGWIKYASDLDPWNEIFYNPIDEPFAATDGTLTHEMITKCSCELSQLPDTKAFVFSRLHINKLGLEDINVLSNYRYFRYIDLSWNHINDLTALNNCNYLMYLNASHNKLRQVLDFNPPWFLTHVNLCCNEIREIGDFLSNFWSLTHLDLSYNIIGKIEGLQSLVYLKYLNLSHNHIKQIENLDCQNLLELNLAHNEISCYVSEDFSLQNLKKLRELNVAHNSLSSLLPLQELITLKALDASNNLIREFYEIDCISGFKNLKKLKMTNNPLSSSTGYREFIIFKVPSLDSLDSVPVYSSERVAAKMCWEPDIFTKSFHIRTITEFWNQIASLPIDLVTTPCDVPPVPLLVLVGTFINNKEEVAKRLNLKFPDQVYRCKKYTTIPQLYNYDEDNLISISMDEFIIKIKTGNLLFFHKELGYFFGVGVEELGNCVIDGKIGIIETTLEAALVMKKSGYRPFMVLCVLDDTKSYKEKLEEFFINSGLWTKTSESFHKNGNTGNETMTCSDTLQEQEQNSGSDLKENTYNYSNIDFQSLYSEHSKCFTLESSKISKSTGATGSQNNSGQEYCVDYEDLPGKTSSSVSDDDRWTWTYEPSIISLDEPSESYLNMMKGRDIFVLKTMTKQEMYLEINNAEPSLFTAAVHTDDIDSAVKTIGKTCCDIFNNQKNRTCCENEIENIISSNFVKERVKNLMNIVVNIPINMKY